MSTIVGGWCSTKKRGRDDDAIERDRKEAIARRKERRNRKQVKVSSLLYNKFSQRGDSVSKSDIQRGKDKDESSSPLRSWVKPPCRHPPYTKHRRRQVPRSTQRELFPNRWSIKMKTKDRPPLLLCDRCGDAIEPTLSTIHPPLAKITRSTTTLSDRLEPKATLERESRSNRGCGRQRSKIVVTPDQPISEIPPSKIETPSIRPGNCNRKVLSFAQEGRSSSRRQHPHGRATHSLREPKRQSSSAAKMLNKALSKPSRRKTQLLGPEPNFALSARLVFETIRRPRKNFANNNAREQLLPKSIAVDGRSDHAVAGRRLAASYATQQHPEPVEEPRHQSAWLSENPGKSTTTTRVKSEESELNRNLLQGTNSHRTNETSSILRSHCPSAQSRTKEYSETEEISKESRNRTSSIEKTSGSDRNTRWSETIPQFDTQQVDAVPKFRGGEEPPSLSSNDGNRETPNNGPLEAATITKRELPSSHCFTQQNGAANCEWEATPSQTPSTASSAVLSLPINLDPPLHFSPPQEMSRAIDNSPCRGLQALPNPGGRVALRGDGDCLAETTSAKVQRRRKPEDPLRDIEFWQGISKKGKKDRNDNGDSDDSPRTFKQTLADLVIAKNTTDTGMKQDHNYGFLWLPSLLEGGVEHTGLVDK